MIGKLVWGTLVALSIVATVMLANFWWSWVYAPDPKPIASTYEPTPATNDWPRPPETGFGQPRRVQIWSEGNSVANVDLETRMGDGPWVPMATITNPTTVGEMWSVPAGQLRVRVTAYTAGTLHWRGPGCKADDVSTVLYQECGDE